MIKKLRIFTLLQIAETRNIYLSLFKVGTKCLAAFTENIALTLSKLNNAHKL